MKTARDVWLWWIIHYGHAYLSTVYIKHVPHVCPASLTSAACITLTDAQYCIYYRWLHLGVDTSQKNMT